MPAAVRGGSRNEAKPRAKAPANASRPRAPQGRGKAAAYTPGKLNAAQGIGLSPYAALGAAAGVLVIALAVTLATGHRGERVV